MIPFFWRKKQPVLTKEKPHYRLLVERGGVQEAVSVEQFEQITGIQFIPHLEGDLHKIQKKMKKGTPTRAQGWLGAYFKSEILEATMPDVLFRHIDPELGWGVFAARPFKEREFIAEYAGTLRKRRRSDKKNAYCFEYIVTPDQSTRYVIDAREQGGVARFINHSSEPNLQSALATVDGISHVILYTLRPIAEGEQLSYDYGPDYWASRRAPIALPNMGRSDIIFT